MSNVVQFLEALARSPKTLSEDAFAAQIAGAGLEPAVRQALLERDTVGLSDAIGGRRNVMCLIAPAENDEPQEEEHESEDEPSREAQSRAA